MKRIAALVFLAAALVGCKRNAPVAVKLWMGPKGGCIELKPNPKFPRFQCWGPGPATAKTFKDGVPSQLALGAAKSCGFFGEKLECWEGEGEPVDTGIRGKGGGKIAMGPNHYCVAYNWDGDHFHCEGSNAEGQFGKEGEWTRGTASIQFVAVGEAHTCVAYTNGEGVQCRGRGVGEEPLLRGNELVDLRAGKDHTCAVTKPGRVYCWGKNDAGQLGDGTTNDAAVATMVPAVQGAIQVALGDRHTCALLANRTVSCWGANEHHQLANGTTEKSAHPAMVMGALGVWGIEAAANGTCARLGTDGEVRCWGANEHGQLGDGSTVEHSVPAAIKFH